MMDFIPEAHTLLMVVAGVPRVKPEDTIGDIFSKINNKIQISCPVANVSNIFLHVSNFLYQ